MPVQAAGRGDSRELPEATKPPQHSDYPDLLHEFSAALAPDRHPKKWRFFKPITITRPLIRA